MTTVMGLVIPYDERRKAYLRRIDSEGEQLSAIVGGPLEMVRLGPISHMYINEEAKLQGLPYNITANRIIKHSTIGGLPKPSMIFRGPLGGGMVDEDGNDFIAGHAVILGSQNMPYEGNVNAEVMAWCDQAEVEVIQSVGGLNVPREGASRPAPVESEVIRLAREEAAARQRFIDAGGDPDALEREMMESAQRKGTPPIHIAGGDADERTAEMRAQIHEVQNRAYRGPFSVSRTEREALADDMMDEAGLDVNAEFRDQVAQKELSIFRRPNGTRHTGGRHRHGG